MALSTSGIMEVRQNGVDTNGGMFNPANANLLTNGSATSGNTSSPVFSTASYNFVAGDVGAYIFIKAGTNCTPGWYKIASVASNNATLTGQIASVASPSSITFGIDYSQQAAAKFTYTDVASGGANSNALTSATHPFGVQMVGNHIQLASGTNVNAGLYEIVSVAGSTATVGGAQNATTAGGAMASGVGSMGGAFATPGKAMSFMAATLGIKCWIQYSATAYSQTTTATNSGGGGTGANLSQVISGYYQTRGDIHLQADGSYSNNVNRPVVQVGANSIAAFTINGFATIRHIIVDCNQAGGFTGTIGIKGSSGGSGFTLAVNCKVKNFTSMGFQGFTTDTLTLEDCEACYGTSAATYAISMSNAQTIWKCYVHDNACSGINAAYNTVARCIIVNNTGTTSDGINGNGSFEIPVLFNNIIIANGRHGINGGNTNDSQAFLIKNNILGRNGISTAGYGISMNSAVACPAASSVDGNVYWFNTTGTRHLMDDTGSANAENYDSPYTNVRDITLTADDAHNPFVRYGISGSTYSATDLASTNGTNATPTVTSVTYTFLTSDIGSTIQITTQTGNWLEGTYLIGSISGGGAVLDRPVASAASVSGATYYFNDFRLNNTAGAGASCRKVATPSIPGGYPPTYAGGSPDYGVLQHADPTSGGGCPIVGSPIVTAA